MDFSKEFSSPRSTAANPSGSDSKKNSQGMEITERNDENCKPNNKELAENKPKNFMSMTLSSASKRKILAEKNEAALINSSDANPGKKPQMKSNMTSQPSSDCFEIILHSEQICSFAHDNTPLADNYDSFPYDPLTNYTCPRPQFLRYNPDRRREILLRADGELRSLDESGSDSSPCYSPRKVVEESAPSFDSKLSIHDHDKEVEGSEEDDYDEDDNLEANEDEKPRKTWKLATLLFILIVWGLFIHSLNPGFDPSLQEYGNIGLAQDDNLAYYLNVHHGYIMGVMMGLSDVCLDMPRSESTCGIEDNSRESVVSKDPLSSEWQEEYSHFRDQEPPNGSELVIERDEDPHGNELVNKKDVDLFINDLEVVKENIHGVISFVDEDNRKSICKKLDIYYFAEQCYERDVAMEVHLSDSSVIHYFSSTSLRAAEIPLANAGFANEQDGEQKLESFKTETESEEKEHVMESAELAQRVSMVTTDDQGTDMHEILNTSGAKFNLGVFFTSSSKNVMQLLLLCFFLATVSFTCLYKYNIKCQRMSMQATKTPVLMKTSSASELGVDENISSTVSTQMGGNMIPYSDVHQKCLRNPTGDHGRFSSIKAPVVESSAKSPVVESGIKALAVESSIKAPIVELLGEFSIAKGPTSEIGPGQRFKRRDLNPEITLIDQSQKLSERMSCASEASLTTKFVSNASTTVQKQLSKENSGVRMEVRKTVDAPTPLRRSSRIRNRITSP